MANEFSRPKKKPRGQIPRDVVPPTIREALEAGDLDKVYDLVQDTMFELIDLFAQKHCTGRELASIVKMDYSTLDKIIKDQYGMPLVEYCESRKQAGAGLLRVRAFDLAMCGKYQALTIFMLKNLCDLHDERTTINEQGDKASAAVNQMLDIWKTYTEGKIKNDAAVTNKQGVDVDRGGVEGSTQVYQKDIPPLPKSGIITEQSHGSTEQTIDRIASQVQL